MDVKFKLEKDVFTMEATIENCDPEKIRSITPGTSESVEGGSELLGQTIYGLMGIFQQMTGTPQDGEWTFTMTLPDE